MFKRRLRLVTQTTSAECGLACIAMIANYFGFKNSLSYYRKILNIGRDGVSVANLFKLLKQVNLSPSAYKLVDIEGFNFSENPYILYTNENHYVVLKKNRKNFSVFDPSSGKKKMSLNEVSEINGGILFEVSKSKEFRKNKNNISDFRYIIFFLNNVLKEFSLVLLFSILSYAISVGIPQLLEYIINSFVNDSKVNLSSIYIILFFMIVLYFLISYLENFFIIQFQTKVKNNITLFTIKHLINLPYSYFDDRGEGNILYRLGFSSQLVDLICNKMIRTILSSLGVLILSLYTIYRFSSLLVLVLLMILLLGILVMFFNFYILSEKDEELSKESKYKELEVEIVSNIFSIKSSRKSNYFLNDYKNKFLSFLDKNAKNNGKIYFFNLIISTYTMFFPIVLVLYSIQNLNVRAGEIFFLYSVISMILANVASFFTQVCDIIMVKPSLFYLNDIYDEEEMVLLGQESIDDFQELKVEGVTFKYNDVSDNVLKNINFILRRGEKVSIVGLSGSGKSSIIKLLTGLYNKFSGNILINDIPLEKIDESFFQKNISVVNQNVTIFNKTIRDNIILGNSSTTDEEIWEALKIVHLDEFIKELPLGLNTIVSSHGANFSGGQAQRLCLARAIINKPQLLILDEATSSLDTVNENYFYNMIKSLGVTILSISHRLNTVVDSDRIYLIDDGEFVAEGSHESLLKTSNLYAKIYNEKRK